LRHRRPGSGLRSRHRDPEMAGLTRPRSAGCLSLGPCSETPTQWPWEAVLLAWPFPHSSSPAGSGGHPRLPRVARRGGTWWKWPHVRSVR
ncbi:hypothetical protein E2320_006367, partial [Naja naja]